MAYTLTRLILFIILPVSFTVIAGESTKILNGFELSDALIPPDQIFPGGPAKDGIPSIDKPGFVSTRHAEFLSKRDRVLGIEINGVAKAYPIKILNWHEIVNDSVGDMNFTITYCPLCGTGTAFDGNIGGRTLSFGVSGLLYNSDVLLYDRETGSLWSQLYSGAVTGEYQGTKLTMLPVMNTTWSDWKRYHPSTLVLSENTGYWRSYQKNPYSGYDKSRHLYFPVFNKAPPICHPKERVLGIVVGDATKAYPFIELNKNIKNKFTDTVNGKTITVNWNDKEQSGFITDDEGLVVPIVQSYWFAWYAFHPSTQVFSAGDNSENEEGK